jgi:hypothetical protein
VEEHKNVVEAYVVRAVHRILQERPEVDVRFTTAIHPSCHFEGRSALYLHPEHRDMIVGIRRSTSPR